MQSYSTNIFFMNYCIMLKCHVKQIRLCRHCEKYGCHFCFVSMLRISLNFHFWSLSWKTPIISHWYRHTVTQLIHYGIYMYILMSIKFTVCWRFCKTCIELIKPFVCLSSSCQSNSTSCVLWSNQLKFKLNRWTKESTNSAAGMRCFWHKLKNFSCFILYMWPWSTKPVLQVYL